MKLLSIINQSNIHKDLSYKSDFCCKNKQNNISSNNVISNNISAVPYAHAGIYFNFKGTTAIKEMTPEAEILYKKTDSKLHKPAIYSPEIIDKNLGFIKDETDYSLEGLNEQYRLREQDWNVKLAWHKDLLAMIKEPTEKNFIDLDNITVEESTVDKQERNHMFTYHFVEYMNSHIYNAMKECKDLTFDSPDLNLMKEHYDKTNIYDLGLRYAIVANNTVNKRGNAVIINEIPEIFKGVDEKELVRKLDILPLKLVKNANNIFSIDDKCFSAKKIGIGNINDIYLISDNYGNKVCYRSTKDPYHVLQGHGSYNEFAIAQEAYKAGVVDVPKLYMANPVGRYVNDGRKQGCWQIVEYIPDNAPHVKKGLKFFDWLHDKGLVHDDLNSGVMVNDYIVDMGGIDDNSIISNETIGNYSPIIKGYNNGETTNSLLEKIEWHIQQGHIKK